MDSLLLVKECDSCLTGWHCVFLEVTVGVCALQGGSSIWANSPGVCRDSWWRPQVWDGMEISDAELSVELLL